MFFGLYDKAPDFWKSAHRTESQSGNVRAVQFQWSGSHEEHGHACNLSVSKFPETWLRAFDTHVPPFVLSYSGLYCTILYSAHMTGALLAEALHNLRTRKGDEPRL